MLKKREDISKGFLLTYKERAELSSLSSKRSYSIQAPHTKKYKSGPALSLAHFQASQWCVVSQYD